MSGQVIFVDDEEHLRTALSQALELAGFGVESHASADGALDRIDRRWPGVVVSDVRMAGMNGLELLSVVLERDPDLPVILITGHGDVPMAVQAIRDGAYDFIEKPFAPETLVEAVSRAVEKRHLVMENRALRESLNGTSVLETMIVGASDATNRLRADVESFAQTDADVLVHGETGTGKELVARALHQLSPRADAPFVPVNCAALPESLIESELFGHEKGAFTGAHDTRVGKFEHADGGTLFLDEIESMPLELQGRLLRVLEDRHIVRLGANDEIPVDVRVIAATKADLKNSDAGSFREDLYYRLNVLSIRILPLRERKEDIPALMAHFLEQAAMRFKRPLRLLEPGDLLLLSHYPWPGNIRELKNAALRYALGQGLNLSDGDADSQTLTPSAASLAEQVADFEKRRILQSLDRNGQKLKATYEELGISRKTLYDKIRKYGIGGSALEDD
ncbi:MAG: sigma-54-dependent transcriptional regulator [Alphaproteobacteria bacterium]